MFRENISLLEDFEITQGDSTEVTFLSPGYNEIMDSNWICTLSITDTARTEIKLQRDVPKTVDSKYFKLMLLPSETISLDAGTYKFSVEVKNNLLNYNKELINCYIKVSQNLVTVIPSAPVFNGTNIISVPENQVTCTTLDATDTLIYSISGGDADDFNINENTGEVTFKVAPNFEVKNLYTFVATAQGLGGTTNQSFIVNITDVAIEPPAPVFITPNTVNQPENQYNAILLQATDTMLYSISGADSSEFNIDSQTGLVKFNHKPDYEVKNVYQFIASASGPGGVTNEIITINITDVNEFPVPYFTMYNIVDIEEGGYEAINLRAENTTSFSISDGDSIYLNCNSEDGTVMFKQKTNYKTKNVYHFTATATGLGGSVDKDITINILEVIGE